MLAAAGLAMLACMPSAQAADTTPPDPGPGRKLPWKGFNWEKRFWGGAPQYNGSLTPPTSATPTQTATSP